ncbi:biopolymer transporter ExbB [filamentous cyanobacterium CCP5]|nr:biopolymer transporter ExbB [filamentous cyanobacterium CCP5]
MPDLFRAGGVTMLPLLIFSFVSLALALERSWFWIRLQGQQRPLVEQVIGVYRQQPEAAISKLKQYPHLPVARIFLAALADRNLDPEEFRLALENATQAELPHLKRFQTFFETVTGVAPLLGLLGTILGLIQALSALQPGQTQVPMGVTVGIGEALISTAAGLLIAITTLLLASLFRALYRRQISFLQTAAGHLELLHRRQQRS